MSGPARDFFFAPPARLTSCPQIQLPIPAAGIFHTPSKAHRGAVTCAVASEDASWLYTASKDGSIIKWDLRSLASTSTTPRIIQAVYFPKQLTEAKKLVKSAQQSAQAKKNDKGKSKAEAVGGHTDEVLALALSFDGTVLASGGKDKVVGVWNVEGESGKWTRGLGGHKDKVAVRGSLPRLAILPLADLFWP